MKDSTRPRTENTLRNVTGYQKDGILYRNYHWQEDCKLREKSIGNNVEWNKSDKIIYENTLQNVRGKKTLKKKRKRLELPQNISRSSGKGKDTMEDSFQIIISQTFSNAQITSVIKKKKGNCRHSQVSNRVPWPDASDFILEVLKLNDEAILITSCITKTTFRFGGLTARGNPFVISV